MISELRPLLRTDNCRASPRPGAEPETATASPKRLCATCEPLAVRARSVSRQCRRVGVHSWLESNDWAIDASNGASRAVLVMKSNTYRTLQAARNMNTSEDILKDCRAAGMRK